MVKSVQSLYSPSREVLITYVQMPATKVEIPHMLLPLLIRIYPFSPHAVPVIKKDAIKSVTVLPLTLIIPDDPKVSQLCVRSVSNDKKCLVVF